VKILVIGAGVIGSTYSWKLSQAGHDLTHLIRKEKADYYLENGIHIKCFENILSKNEVDTVYKPKIIDRLDQNPNFDLIIVSVHCEKIECVLEMLKDRVGNASILFLQNIRPADINLINNYINPSQYLIGYPFIAGGGKKGNNIETAILRSPINHTMLGEVDGSITERLKNIKDILRKAKMKPMLTNSIIPYIKSHYIWAACVSAAYLKAGSFRNFVGKSIYIKESYIAMRETWEICKKEGIRPDKMAPTKYFYFPLFLLVPLTRFMYNSKVMQVMFDGHILHGFEEIKTMYYDILQSGEKLKINMPTFLGFKKYVDNFKGL
jgi:2-dehydropantoate 2-reductase